MLLKLYSYICFANKKEAWTVRTAMGVFLKRIDNYEHVCQI